MANPNSCPRCNTDNREGRRFCASCGAALPRPCPSCEFLNSPDDGFCGGCGGKLEQAKATGGLAASRETAAEQGELRQVTILFADLSGYTALAAQRDPEEMHAILQHFFEGVDSAVTRFGGGIERHIGDNVMGVFGAPLAHGDDPYRAVRAAGEIHRVVASIAEKTKASLSVHIGIACGTVMARTSGSTLKAAYGVVGSPVNLAARLQGNAAPGETLVSDAVRDATEELIDFEAMGLVELKGLPAPVPVWRLKAERQERTIERLVPLVGRRAELNLLGSLLDDVSESGLGKTIYVRGEAGIGKTRLMQALDQLARERGYSCHKALVLDFGAGQGRDATRTLVAEMLGLTPASSEQDRSMAATKALDKAFIAPDKAVILHDLLDVPLTGDLRALNETMDDAARVRGRRSVAVDLVRSLSALHPLLLIVEDLHWADRTTLDNLAAIAAADHECRVVLAMTSRVEGDQLDDAWRGRVRGGITAIDLAPLRPEEASQFGERLLIANAEWLQRCIDRADGNPLFLEQLLRNSEESAEAEDIPASIQSLVLSRMDRLPAPDRAALQVAAIAGQRFSLAFVHALLRDETYNPANLLQHQMIRPEGEEFLFSHALVRDGVYSSLTQERRRQLHRVAAEFHRNRDPVLYAEHLEQAHDPQAASAYCKAAAAEAAEYRFDRALALTERGRLAEGKEAESFHLDALRGEYLLEIGRSAESLDAWQSALGASSTPYERCRALIGIAAVNRLLSRYEPALSALAQAQLLALSEDSSIERAQIHYYRGNIRFAQGDTQNCLAEHQSALAAADHADSAEWRARASSGVGDALYSSCRMQTAAQAFQSCIDICDAGGFGRVALPNRLMVAHCMIYLQRIDDALPMIENTRKIAALAGNPQAEMFATQSMVTALVESGRLQEASEYIAEALTKVRQLGAKRYESNVLAKAAEYQLHFGSRSEALKLAQESVAISRVLGMGFTGPYALAVLAAATDEQSLRAEALAEGEALLAKSVGHNRIWHYRVAADIHLNDRKWDEANRCADELLRVTALEPLPLVEFLVARIRVLAKLASGDRGLQLEVELDRLIQEATIKRHDVWLTALRLARDSLVPAG